MLNSQKDLNEDFLEFREALMGAVGRIASDGDLNAQRLEGVPK